VPVRGRLRVRGRGSGEAPLHLRQLDLPCDAALGEVLAKKGELAAAVLDRAPRVAVGAHVLTELIDEHRPAARVGGLAGNDSAALLASAAHQHTRRAQSGRCVDASLGERSAAMTVTVSSVVSPDRSWS